MADRSSSRVRSRARPRFRSRFWAALVALGVGLAPLAVALPAQAADDAVVETVLSVPGTPTRRQWPPVKIAARICSMTASCPTIIL